MMTCDSGNVLTKTGCILSYNGSVTDIVINYTLFALNLAWCIIALHLHTTDIRKRVHLRRFAIGSLLFVICFQITICLLLHCFGISIVWCAMGGWIVSERKRLRRLGDDLNSFRKVAVVAEMLVMLLDVAAIVYYAVVAGAITTLAHVLSLILGATLSLVSIKRYDEVGGIEPSPSTPLVDK